VGSASPRPGDDDPRENSPASVPLGFRSSEHSGSPATSRLKNLGGLARGNLDGCVYGRRLLPAFGLPAGLAYGHFMLGDRAAAIRLAEQALDHSGGYVRLRALALHLLVQIRGDEEGAPARRHALAIARRIEDEDLLGRIDRRR